MRGDRPPADSPPGPAVSAPKSWRQPSEHWQTVLTHPWYRNLVDLQDVLTASIGQFLRERGLKSVLMPSTTGSISSPMGLGSDSRPVEIDLCGVKTYLADSMQFMLELGCRPHPDGVFYVMPCFRGEQTDASHLAQFYHAECEIPGTLDDITALVDDLVRAASAALLAEAARSLSEMTFDLEHLHAMRDGTSAIPRIRFDEAISDLGKDRSEYVNRNPAGFRTLTRAGERELVRRHGGSRQAVWVTHFDELSVPFYQAPELGTGAALAADLLLAGQETVGSGQRHSSAEAVLRACHRHGVASEPYAWYGRMREVSGVQTSGMGLGIERFLMWALQHDDIRDLTLLYRENGVDILP
jgi:asparaginyl-tRNA synthetase